MANFPTHSFSEDNVEVRFRERRLSESVSRRCYGLPRGVYVGYEPQVQGGSLVLSLAIDSRVGFSSLKVGSQSLPVQVDIFTKESVTLNFTGHTQFPVFVIARADYARDVHTQGRILTRATGATGPQEINICKVNKPSADLVVDVTLPANRHLPVAYDGQAFGYMLPGAAEDIIFAQSVTAEVIRARYSLATPDALPPTLPPTGQLLADRLVLDLSADYLAAQMGLRNNVLVGNAKSLPAGGNSANVSGSFASTSREFEPKLTLDGGGSESTEGAITAPTDVVRNVCFLIKETTGERIIDADRHPVYGRLGFSSGPLSGTFLFTNAQVAVVGTATLFLTELEVGDIILGDDGVWYEVESVPDNFNLELSAAYQGVTVAAASSSYRRITLSFFSRGTGAEVAHTLADPVNMRFFFSAWNRTDRSAFDALAFMHRTGERPVLEEASGSVAGRIRLAAAGSKAGAIRTITDAQVAIGANFHTLNFSANNAVITPAGTGVANIDVPGDQGPLGDGSLVGPQGSPGVPGTGFIRSEPFVLSDPILGGAGSFTVDFAAIFEPGATPFSTPLTHVVGGFAGFRSNGTYFGQWHQQQAFEMTDVVHVSDFVARVDYSLGVESNGRFFIGVCS